MTRFLFVLLALFYQAAFGQIIDFYPEIDTLYISSGCTPPEIICSVTRDTTLVDTINIRAGFNTSLYSPELEGYEKWFQRAYFEIADSSGQFEYELWIIPDNKSLYLPSLIKFDTTLTYLWETRRDFDLKLLVREGDMIIDSSLQHCHLDFGVQVEQKADLIYRRSSVKLYKNHPNPFNPATTIRFELPRGENVSLHIIDLLGRRVRTLVESRMGVGEHSVVWDGLDDDETQAAAGIYFARLRVGDETRTIKLLLVR